MKLILKIIVLGTICLSVFSGLIPTLYGWLIFSTAGIKKLFLWQLITYIFVEKGPISLNFFLNLAFNMYILWIFGAHLLERSSIRHFLTLYFGAALLGSISVLTLPNAFLAGSSNGVYAILIAWMLLNQDAKLLLFFTIPFRALWLVLGLIGATLLINLSISYWAGVISLTIACAYSYFFTLVVWRQPSPFPLLKKMEKKFFRFLERRKHHEPYTHSKIYDIKSGEPILDDDQFMDAMLDRISRHGEGSLTPAERKRMKEISSRK